MKAIVAVVISLTLALPAGAASSSGPRGLLHRASQASGLPIRKPVRSATFVASRYDALYRRALAAEYPRALQEIDAQLYARLGLGPRSVPNSTSRAWYDTSSRTLLLRRQPAPTRLLKIHELVRALVDQNFNLRRLRGLRQRDRDKAIAARAIVDGTGALASRLRPTPLRGTPLDRFLQLERDAGLGPGRSLASELRYLGGRRALNTALRTFPQTTEQLLHIDKYLESERAIALRLPARVGDLSLAMSQTFGELDVRNLFQAFGVPNAAAAAAGWGGGQLALYRTGAGQPVAGLVLRWDTLEDAAEWRDAASRYLGSAFPNATPHDCPPLDRCWSATTDLAAGMLGETAVFASGPGAAALGAALLTLK